MTILLALVALARAQEPTATPDAAAPAAPATPTAAASAPPSAPAATTAAAPMRFWLLDGQQLHGPAERIEGGWSVDVRGVRILLPESVIARALPDDGTTTTTAAAPPAATTTAAVNPGALRDANRTRYFYAPSAFTLGHGRGYVSQKEVAFTSAAIGISPFMDVQVGTVIPLLFTNEPVAIVGAKVAVPLTPTVRVGGGAQVLANLEYPITLPFVVATVGTEARNVSVTAGSFGADPQDRVTLYNVAAMVRVRDNLSILSENYFVSEAGYPFYIPSGGARFHGRSFAADVGFFMPFSPYESGFIPIPWLDLTWNFDLRKP